MDFEKALEAMNDGQKVRRPIMIDGSYVIVETDKFIAVSNCFGYISQCEFYPSFKDCVADDWEIVPDAPELNPEEMLSKFRDWLKSAIVHSCGTPGDGHTYLCECLDKLDELSSSKPAGQKTPEKCTVVSIIDNKAIVKTESGQLIIVNQTGLWL